MTDPEQDLLEKSSEYRAWRCGKCDRRFVTENIDDTSMCPYCGCVTITASEDTFNVTRE